VVRIAGTPGATGSVDGDPLAAEDQTPIPGLRVEVLEELLTTPVAIHEVLTDKNGRPLSTIEVDSASDIVIQSKDETVAKFAAAGPASEFANPLEPAIVATPMINQGAACRTVVEGTPIVQFNYSNTNDPATSALVPITGLNADLYRTPDSVDDDLLLNSVRHGDNDIIPDSANRAPAPNETSQLFTPGDGSFRVPYDTTFGPLTWRFIGGEVVVDGSTALCQEEGTIRCEEISAQLIERLVSELRISVSGTLKIASRYMKLGKTPYLRTTARAIRTMRAQSASLLGSYVCPQGAALPNSCRRIKFPVEDLARTHAGIFSQPSPIKPRVFEKLQKLYNTRYRRFLNRSFPSEIVVCSK
jgi:hypothetical protein